jgi:hypothetical protein
MKALATIRPKAAPAIDPDVKEFVDMLLVPILVRAALDDLAEEKQLAQSRPAIAKSRSDNE